MANLEEIVSTLIRIIYDKQSGDATNRELKSTRKNLDDIVAAAKRVEITAPDVSDVYAKNTGAIIKLKDAFDEVAKSQQKVAQGANLSENIGRIGQVGSRALRGVGLGGVGEAFNVAGDLADLGQIKNSVGELVNSIKPIADIADDIALAAPGIGAFGSGIAALGLAVAPIAAVILGVVAVFKTLQDSAEAAAKAEQDLIDTTNKQFDINYQIKQEANQKTKEQLAQEYDNTRAEYDLIQAKLDAAKARKAQIDKEFADLGGSFNPLARSDLGARGQTEQKNIDDLTKQLAGLQDQLVVTTGAMQDTTQATKEAGESALKAAQDHLQAMTENQRMQQQLDDLAATGTSKQAETLLASNQRQIDSLKVYQQAALEYAQTLKQGSAENKLASDQAEAYGHQIALLTDQNQRLTDSTLPVIQAREKEAAALDYQKKQLEETTDAVKKYNSDVDSLNGKLQESRDKLIDTLDEIFANAQKAAEEALAKLYQREAELTQNAQREADKAARDADRERVKIAIDEGRQEVEIYKNYRRKLRDIQRQADEQSFELALNRDFSGLFNLNRQTDSAKQQAAQDERDQIDDAREARQQQLEDLQRSLEAERQERQIALAQQIADAVSAYQQQRLQIEAQRKDAEIKARAAAAKEQQLLQQQLDSRAAAIRAELQLIQQGETARLQITSQAMNALVAQAQALLNALSGNTGSGGGGGFSPGVTHSAFGNFLRSGQASTVNELPGQRESFAGKLLPKGFGLFIPGRSGQVSPNGGSMNITLVQNIQGGANAELIADIAARKSREQLKTLLGMT